MPLLHCFLITIHIFIRQEDKCKCKCNPFGLTFFQKKNNFPELNHYNLKCNGFALKIFTIIFSVKTNYIVLLLENISYCFKNFTPDRYTRRYLYGISNSKLQNLQL